MKASSSSRLAFHAAASLLALTSFVAAAQSVHPGDWEKPQTPYERIVVPGMERLARAHGKDPRRKFPTPPDSSGASASGFGGFVAAPKFVAGNLSGWDSRDSGLSVFASGDFNHDGRPDVATVQSTGEVSLILNQTQSASAPIAFSPPISAHFGAIGGAIQQALGIDVNGDGYDDLVLLNSTNNCIEILINRKDETFATPVQLALGNPHRAIAFAMANLNGGRRPDLLLLSSSFTYEPGGGVAATTLEFDTYLNDGSGHFLNPSGNLKQIQTYNGEYDALDGRSIVLTDVNNDGKTDATVELRRKLTTISPDQEHVVITMLGVGSGAFQMPNARATITIPSAGTVNIGFPLVAHLNVADINGDKIKDLVFSYQDYSIYVALGKGDGTYRAPHNVGAWGAYPTDLLVADLNGDGVQDLVDAEPAYLAIYPGRGDGTFDIGGIRHYGSGFGESSVLSIADFNGDGLPDPALLNSSEGSVTVFPSQAGSEPALVAGPLLGKDSRSRYIQRVQAQTVLDANHDGNDDIFFYSKDSTIGNPPLVTALGDGRGDFSNIDAVPGFHGETVDFIEAVSGDFNKDGLSDIVLHTFSELVLLLSNGNGTFREKPISLGQHFNCRTSSAALGDVNGDGKLDIVVAYAGAASNCQDGGLPSGFFVLLGNGDATFQAPKFTVLGSVLFEPVLADLNGDGKLDLLISDTPFPPHPGDFETHVLLGNGDGTFGASATILRHYLNVFMRAGDVNGDGHPDLVVMSQGLTNAGKEYPDQTEAGAQVLLGNGKGGFSSPSSFLEGFFGPFVLADLNGDGKLDLLLSEAASFDFTEPFAGAVVGLGNGDGTFSAVGNYEAGAQSSVVLLGNFLKGNPPSAAFVSASSGTTLLFSR